MYDEIKANFIQLKWDYNKAEEYSKLSNVDETTQLLEHYIFVGPPGEPKPAPAITISSKKSVPTSATTTTIASAQDDFKSKEKAEGLETPSGGGVDLNSIFMDSCGLQYLTFGGKAFPCQRFVSNIFELRIISEHLYLVHKIQLFNTHNFDDSTPEGLEGEVLFGDSCAIGSMFIMEDSYPAKVQFYGRCHMMGDGIEWSLMIDGSESPYYQRKYIMELTKFYK